jgi:hypothetical protein
MGLFIRVGVLRDLSDRLASWIIFVRFFEPTGLMVVCLFSMFRVFGMNEQPARIVHRDLS